MQNCRRKAPYKIVSTDRRTDRQMDMQTAYAQLHIHINIMCKFRSSTFKNVGVMLWITIILVKFTSSRGENSTTNDSMVMKIEHAQLHMYTNIMYKFQSSMCKTVGEKLRTKLCPWTDRQMDGEPW